VVTDAVPAAVPAAVLDAVVTVANGADAVVPTGVSLIMRKVTSAMKKKYTAKDPTACCFATCHRMGNNLPQCFVCLQRPPQYLGKYCSEHVDHATHAAGFKDLAFFEVIRNCEVLMVSWRLEVEEDLHVFAKALTLAGMCPSNFFQPDWAARVEEMDCIITTE
jgi:hypothetical protein